MKLTVIILLMLLPVIVVLVTWSAIDHIRLDHRFAIQDSEVLTLKLMVILYYYYTIIYSGTSLL